MNATVSPRITVEGRTALQDVIPLATPYLVFVDPSSLCNFQCKFCPTGHRDMVRKFRRPQVMTMETFDRVLSDLCAFPDPIKTLRLYKDGEPLLNKQFPAMVTRAKATGRFGQIDTTTNAALLTPYLAWLLPHTGLDKIFISIAGMSAEKYKEFCGVDIDFDDLVANIKMLYEASRGATEITIKTVAENLSEGEEQQFFNTFGDICDHIFIEHISPCWPGFEGELVGAPDVGIYGNPLADVKVCPYIFYSMSVNAEGTVSLCFLDWKHRMILGDVKKMTLPEIWRGNSLKLFQAVNLNHGHNRVKDCSECGQLTHGMPDDIDQYADEILERLLDDRL